MLNHLTMVSIGLAGAFLIALAQSGCIVKQEEADGSESCTDCTSFRGCSQQIINNKTIQHKEHRSVDVGQMPSHVSLERVLPDGKAAEHFCDGLIIHPNWILAFAHCFDSDSSINFIIRYGTIHADEGGTTVTAERLLVHPNYRPNSSTHAHDLALIRTKTLELNYGGPMAPSEVTLDMMNVTVDSDGSIVTNGLPFEGFDYDGAHRYHLGLYLSVAIYAGCFMIFIGIFCLFGFKYTALRQNPYNYYKADSSFSRCLTSIPSTM